MFLHKIQSFSLSICFAVSGWDILKKQLPLSWSLPSSSYWQLDLVWFLLRAGPLCIELASVPGVCVCVSSALCSSFSVLTCKVNTHSNLELSGRFGSDLFLFLFFLFLTRTPWRTRDPVVPPASYVLFTSCRWSEGFAPTQRNSSTGANHSLVSRSKLRRVAAVAMGVTGTGESSSSCSQASPPHCLHCLGGRNGSQVRVCVWAHICVCVSWTLCLLVLQSR